ncbi:MAG TPA: nuclear transport factor 2 family protein [Vicinamibacterales bacterium]|nr:nuclear transport factor 2 family protein [Vicinamibacterales bacterium]
MTRSEIDVRLARHRAAFASRDPGLLAADHAPSGTFTSPAAGTVSGRARITEVYSYWVTAFPDIEFTWDEPVIDGTRVGLFWRFRGTLAGKFFGEARVGTRVEFPGAALYVVSPDGIESANHVFDFTGALVNAGALKVKPG